MLLAPAVGSYWRYFALCTLGLHFGSFNHPSQDLVCATGEHEREGVLAGGRTPGCRGMHGRRWGKNPPSRPDANSWLPWLLLPTAMHAGERSRDFTDPLRGYESQRVTLRGLWAWLKRSFHPLPPPGLRHNSLPITGIMVGGWLC